jgi:hypothetical protein
MTFTVEHTDLLERLHGGLSMIHPDTLATTDIKITALDLSTLLYAIIGYKRTSSTDIQSFLDDVKSGRLGPGLGVAEMPVNLVDRIQNLVTLAQSQNAMVTGFSNTPLELPIWSDILPTTTLTVDPVVNILARK